MLCSFVIFIIEKYDKTFHINLPLLLSVIQMFICPVSLSASYHQDFDRTYTSERRPKSPKAAKCCHQINGLLIYLFQFDIT